MKNEEIKFITEVRAEQAEPRMTVNMDMSPQIFGGDKDEHIAMYKKIHALHKGMRAIRWEMDGYNEAFKAGYFTANLIKSNFQKACIEAGLIYAFEIDRIEVLPPQKGTHRLLYAYLKLIDIDTGVTYSYPTIGEASDTQDKGCAKLFTMAIKSVIATNFAVADIDPETDLYEKMAGNFTVERERQAQDAVKALNARKASEPISSAKSATSAPKQQKLADKKEDETGKEMTITQKKTMGMIYTTLNESKPEGLDLEKLKKDFENAEKSGTRGDAMKWINKYKGEMK